MSVMVATSVFGMGISKPNIRNIIMYGVPENIRNWAQDLDVLVEVKIPLMLQFFMVRPT